jgi:hypothetical protein
MQSVLNYLPSDQVEGVVPIIPFTIFPAKTPLITMLHRRTLAFADVRHVHEKQSQNVNAVRDALQQMHVEMDVVATKKRQ